MGESATASRDGHGPASVAVERASRRASYAARDSGRDDEHEHDEHLQHEDLARDRAAPGVAEARAWSRLCRTAVRGRELNEHNGDARHSGPHDGLSREQRPARSLEEP